MDFVEASFKISNCIDTATNEQHHIAINRMIKTVTMYAKKQKWYDKTILGALALLDWQNANKFNKSKQNDNSRNN